MAKRKASGKNNGFVYRPVAKKVKRPPKGLITNKVTVSGNFGINIPPGVDLENCGGFRNALVFPPLEPGDLDEPTVIATCVQELLDHYRKVVGKPIKDFSLRMKIESWEVLN